MPTLAVRALILAVCLTAVASAGDEACLKCHGDRAELARSATEKGRPSDALLVDGERFARSVHASRGCTDCHLDFETRPHGSDAETVACAECHEEEAGAFARSIHGQAQKGQADLPVKCGSCHGVHDVMKATERESHLYPFNVPRTCGKCHFDIDTDTATTDELLEQPYTDDTHARGLLHAGLVVSATCVSCHGGHEIRAKGDPESRVSRTNVADACGRCHVFIEEEYRKSVHFEKNREQEGKGATCSDCHPPHAIQRADVDFRRESVAACAKCHEERMGSFQKSYHGKVTSLGFGGEVADCAACHGAHAILPADDPGSRIHPDNRTETCKQCHDKANDEFASYMVHADPDDAEAYPGLNFVQKSMVGLLVGVFSLLYLHGLLWLIRSFLAKERRKKAPDGRYIRRWRQFYVILHVTFMTCFLVLAATGLPIHYADKPWAARIMRALGGPPVAGSAHRLAAIVMIGCIVSYLVNITYRWIVKREKGLWSGPNTMLPRFQDVKDVAANVRWFLGLGPKPRFDRWTYWEKFDFWSVFWGIAIIGGSGLVLWFPEAATGFLPGWTVNVATIIHGHEALLAVGFIFTVHIFHANLRPEKFPMDTLFYTGRMPEPEFKEERPVEYERALATDRYESMLDDPPRTRTRRRAYIVGTIAMIVGISLTLLMFAAILG